MIDPAATPELPLGAAAAADGGRTTPSSAAAVRNKLGTLPIPYWMADRDYFPRNDPRRVAHLKRIEVQARIDARVNASAGDGSYAVTICRDDVDPEHRRGGGKL
ncbi:hypothetical protein [Bradyrhizobium sp. SZCCHNRI2049]|uniref:hypothetical protein n=1 Tax=Bradyrhizobium sp. SZCCHNRI2049 TaxID=3057287 RepID=UPI002916E0A1|nr:hypothetical protein [Bradyrhizobium sp. SZCCHNRI2049]